MDDDDLPYSQVANEAFNQVKSADLGHTSFKDAFNQPPNPNNHNNGGGHPPLPPRAATFSVVNDPFAGKHGKLINDPIHGAYRLDPSYALIFDTRQFQRLRNLRQLGTAYHVFPGASHNRFEHSLGVAHLAERYSTQLWHAQRKELDIDRGDIRVVGLAGLCHDLGHGPFSHVFEREFLRQKGITNWDHEDMSAMMLDFIIDENGVDVFSNDDVRRVKALITSGHTPSDSSTIAAAAASQSATTSPPLGSANRWLGEIVANGRNSIDVDKFDYLARDAYYCGVKVGSDFNRIMQFSRVIDDEICYKYTEYMQLHELFHTRATMHRTVYTHKKSKAIEFMIVDALLALDPALKISEKINDPKQFVQLDDGLLSTIENFALFESVFGEVDEGVHSSIRASQEIIARLRKRQLYKYVTDAPIPVEVLERGQWYVFLIFFLFFFIFFEIFFLKGHFHYSFFVKFTINRAPPTPEDIVSHYHSSDVTLNVDDVIVHEHKIDYSMRNTNPLDKVHFYDVLGSDEKKSLRPDQISAMMVSNFEEKRLRVYSRDGDPRVVTALHEAFESWLQYRFSGHVEASTPAKARRVVVVEKEEGGGGGGGVLLGRQAGLKRGRNLFGAGEGPPRPPTAGSTAAAAALPQAKRR